MLYWENPPQSPFAKGEEVRNFPDLSDQVLPEISITICDLRWFNGDFYWCHLPVSSSFLQLIYKTKISILQIRFILKPRGDSIL